jgi:hypothetical protein
MKHQQPVYVEDLRRRRPARHRCWLREGRLRCAISASSTHQFCLEIIAAPRALSHLYMTNGILSHNTTTASGYLLWRAMFVEDSKILIAANKQAGAYEVMSRIKYAYEECPDYIKDGVKKFNEGTIEFQNGSKIEAVATTADAARGKSLSTPLFGRVCLRSREHGERLLHRREADPLRPVVRSSSRQRREPTKTSSRRFGAARSPKWTNMAIRPPRKPAQRLLRHLGAVVGASRPRRGMGTPVHGRPWASTIRAGIRVSNWRC